MAQNQRDRRLVVYRRWHPKLDYFGSSVSTATRWRNVGRHLHCIRPGVCLEPGNVGYCFSAYPTKLPTQALAWYRWQWHYRWTTVRLAPLKQSQWPKDRRL